MKGTYYRIDWDTCERLHLYGREAMVYCALIYLCKRTPYKGSATELAEFSHCGTKRTTLRMLSSLEKKGLIIRNEQGVTLGQNVTLSGQNVTPSGQNVPISKAKESTKEKEKIIKEEIVVVGQKDVKSQPQQQDFFTVFIPPTWDEIVAFASSKNMPVSLYTKFFSYYSANNWTLKRGAKMENWKATLTYWFETEKESATKSLYKGIYGKATEQQQAEYAGSQYAAYQARKIREQQQEQARQQNEQTRYVSYEEYQKRTDKIGCSNRQC